MRASNLRRVLADGQTAVNAWISGDGHYLAEVLSHAGFDAITVDLQHGMFGIDGALRLMQSVSAGPGMPMVRCSSLNAAEIGKLLDGGAYGVICPSIDTVEQAEQLVQACRYPPRGARSFGPSRGLLYGGPDYVSSFEDEVMVWAMIESATALANVDAIANVDGIDGLFVGPNDLALSLGHRPGAAMPVPEVAQALDRIQAAAHRAGRVAGVFCADGEVGAWMAGIGFDMITPGNDAGLLKAAAVERITRIRNGSPAQAPSAGGGY